MSSLNIEAALNNLVNDMETTCPTSYFRCINSFGWNSSPSDSYVLIIITSVTTWALRIAPKLCRKIIDHVNLHGGSTRSGARLFPTGTGLSSLKRWGKPKQKQRVTDGEDDLRRKFKGCTKRKLKKFRFNYEKLKVLGFLVGRICPPWQQNKENRQATYHSRVLHTIPCSLQLPDETENIPRQGQSFPVRGLSSTWEHFCAQLCANFKFLTNCVYQDGK